MDTIRDVGTKLEQIIGAPVQAYLPQVGGYDVEVDIIENDRKKRSDATCESWNPEMGEIRIRFVARSQVESQASGALEGTEADDFAPVEIRGEPISATVIRERR